MTVQQLETLANVDKAVASYKRMRDACHKRKEMNREVAGEMRGLADDVTNSGADVHHTAEELKRLATRLEG